MAHLITPASILAAMDSTCSPSEMMAYNHHHHHYHHHDTSMPTFDDSDSDSSCSGSSTSSFSTTSLNMHDNSHLLHHPSVHPAVVNLGAHPSATMHGHHQMSMISHGHSHSHSHSYGNTNTLPTTNINTTAATISHNHNTILHNTHNNHNSIIHTTTNTNNNSSNMNTNSINAYNHPAATNVTTIPPGRQSPSGPVTYHYFCNFPTCGYHSARSDPVKRHRDTHYPDYKPYICNYCQSSSARRDSTREHCLKQHKDDSEHAFRYDTMIPKPEGWIAYEPKRSPWPPLMN
ncbi:hypothetical protein BGZ94_008223 [Podila epigama]|nr:hypothetical protein BGZ94_008223 [Podila epigama]